MIGGSLLVLSTACGPNAAERAGNSAKSAYFAGDYATAAAVLQKPAEKTDENYALQNARLGSALLAENHIDEAEGAFSNAYEVMNSVGTNSGGRTLGATLIDEKIRVWKGEPFERAMVCFYLGLIYYIRGDYNNARAAFENSQFKLREYDEKDDKKNKQVESNFALGSLMLAKCWQRLGRDDLAVANFNYVTQLRPDLATLANPDLNRRSNVLLVIDAGYGPRRETEFDNAILAFRPTPSEAGPMPVPFVTVDGQPYNLSGLTQPPVDLLAIAQDRRWQSIDTIRTTKSAIGTGLLAGGGVMGIKGAMEHGGRQSTDLIVAAGLAATGLALKATSQADVREWGMLPRTTYVLPLIIPPGNHTVTMQLSDGSQQTWTNLVAPPEGQKEATYYLRMQRFMGMYLVPGGRARRHHY